MLTGWLQTAVNGKRGCGKGGRRLWQERMESRICLTADLVISEISAVADAVTDGTPTDWVEIYNRGTARVDLQNLYLTDDPRSLSKWQFPQVELKAGEYLVVYASGLNEVDPNGQLHTNFRLASGGESILLVDRDGSTVLDQWKFPAQVSGLSYGRGSEFIVSSPVTEGSEVLYHVPRSKQEVMDWQSPSFDETPNWTAATNGIGFDVLAGQSLEDPLDVFRIDFGQAPDSMVVLQDGWQGFLGNGGETQVSRSFAHPSWATGDDPLRVTVSGNTHYRLYRAATGPFAERSDLLADGPLCNAACTMSIAVGGLKDGSYELRTYHHTTRFGPSDPDSPRPFTPFDVQITDGRRQSVTVAEKLVMSDDGSDSLSQFVTPFAVVDGSEMRIEFIKAGGADHFAVSGLELKRVSPPSVIDVTRTNIEESMYEKNSSVLIRSEFQVAESESIDRVQLKVRYDDGFVAYLNGKETVRRNAFNVAWDAAAPQARSLAEAISAEVIDVTAHADSIHNGANLLAIHGQNVGAADADFLLSAELQLIHVVGEESFGYFAVPTPGQRNSAPDYLGMVDNVSFDQAHGVFDGVEDAFSVRLATATQDAEILYTVDGSKPSMGSDGERNGRLYKEPIFIDRTTTLRAVGIRPGYRPSSIGTRTYLFLSDVVQQSSPPPGYPSTWGSTFTDWGMDQDAGNLQLISGNSKHTVAESREVIKSALRSLPTLSIVLDKEDLFGAERGIYVHTQGRGRAWERPASIEYFDPHDPSVGFQIDAGLRLQGFTSRDPSRNPKHSFRLSFRKEYGGARLDYPLFGSDAAKSFDTLVLRSNSQDAWVYDSSENRVGQFVRDEWARRTQLALGQPAARGTWVHLYLNGLYWGVYNPTERPDSSFLASYLGGEPEEYDALKNHEEFIDGDADAYLEALTLIQNDPLRFRAGYRDLSSDAAYQRILGNDAKGQDDPDLPNYVDVSSLIDYVIHGAYAAAYDWPGNFYMGRWRIADSSGFKFLMWDNEHGMKPGVEENRVLPHSRDADSPTKFYHALRSNEEFRVRFGDHLHRAFSPGGALYVDPEDPEWNPSRSELNQPAALWMELTGEIEEALIAESARWGDTRTARFSDRPLYTPHNQFQEIRNDLLENWFPYRSAIVLDQFRDYGMYPTTNPPILSTHGGVVSTGLELEMAAFFDQAYETTSLLTESGPVAAHVPRDDALDGVNQAPPIWTLPEFDDRHWLHGHGGVGYEWTRGLEDFLGIDLRSLEVPREQRIDADGDRKSDTPSVYTRFKFHLPADFHPDNFDQLLLHMRYDDGFIAYLNGVPVLSVNADEVPHWKSRATVFAEVTTPEKFDITPFKAALISGRENVLAIHAQNRTSIRGDLLVSPQLALGIAQPLKRIPIYYTIDGNDPRLAGGAVHEQAIRYQDAVVLTESTVIKARSYDDGDWSALVEAEFVPDANTATVAISEISYHPSPPTALERQVDPSLDNEDFEYIEIYNPHTKSLPLYGIAFVDGIQFEFPDVTLPSQNYGVIVGNAEAFRLRYGMNANVLGEWQGRLDNGGERIQLADAEGIVILDLMYDDDVPWPTEADGAGDALHHSHVLTPPGEATSWQAGPPSPGVTTTFSMLGDFNGNGGLDVADLDDLCAAILVEQADPIFDLDQNQVIDRADHRFWVESLRETSLGDANLDGIFDEADLTHVFIAGKYEQRQKSVVGWAEGDWNCDGRFTSEDIVAAFQAGGFLPSSAATAIDRAFSEWGHASHLAVLDFS